MITTKIKSAYDLSPGLLIRVGELTDIVMAMSSDNQVIDLNDDWDLEYFASIDPIDNRDEAIEIFTRDLFNKIRADDAFIISESVDSINAGEIAAFKNLPYFVREVERYEHGKNFSKKWYNPVSMLLGLSAGGFSLSLAPFDTDITSVYNFSIAGFFTAGGYLFSRVFVYAHSVQHYKSELERAAQTFQRTVLETIAETSQYN